jgi:hypothetical protein
MVSDNTQTDNCDFVQIQGPMTYALDAAGEYLRVRGLRLAPVYLLGMLPFSVAILFLIDAIGAEHHSGTMWWCMGLVVALVWRWCFLARVQQCVQRELQARAGLPLFTRLPWILLFRLYANVALTWGSMLLVPSFYAFFAGSFAAPVLLEREGPAPREIGRMLGWVHHSAGRLSRAVISLTVFSLIMALVVYIVQRAIVNFVLPSLLGMDATGMELTMRGWTWLLSWLYFLFLALDFAWTVAAVFLYYDSQSRRTGSDLRARLQALAGGEAGGTP